MRDDQKRMLGAVLGVLAAVLILLIGFFRTLLITLFAALGWYLASHKRAIMRELTWALRRIRRI